MTSGFAWVHILFGIVSTAQSAPAPAEATLPDARPVPAVQVLPLPYHQASFQYWNKELTRYHSGPSLNRPFLYPLIGPTGSSYTRMGHPRDPVSHSHHNSVWISHANVNGTDFWADTSGCRIVCEQVQEYEDGADRAWLTAVSRWQDAEGQGLMLDRRRITVEPLPGGDWRMIIDLQLEAPGKDPVTLGVTPFGPIGVRMAKTIGVKDGGGRILDSEGRLNEKEIFRKPSRWVDYSGPVSRDAAGGITLMDHPSNPNHPVAFHVRDDGWMGACLTLQQAQVIKPGQPLRLCYGLWVHGRVVARQEIEPQWRAFTAGALADLQPRRR